MIHIVTHGDLDGLTSASIIYDILSKNKERILLHIAQPFNLYTYLRNIALEKETTELYILDIGLDEATWNKTYTEIKTLHRRGIKIVWIDHHLATLNHLIEIISLDITLLFSIKGSTVTLIGKNFLHITSDPNFYMKLVIIGEVGDKIRKIKDDHPLVKPIEYIGSSLVANPSDEQFKINIVKQWVKQKELLNDEILKRYKEAVNRLKELVKYSQGRIIYEDNKIIIIDLRETRVHGYVGKIASYYVSKLDKITFILFKANPFETIVTCRVPISKNFNASKILPSIAKRYGGGGGGHKKAASIRIPREMTEQFIHDLKNFFKKNDGPGGI